MIKEFIAGQIFAPVIPMTDKRTLAYIIDRTGDVMTVAECDHIQKVRILRNEGFGNEFAQFRGRTYDYTISAPTALTGAALKDARKTILQQLARGGV